jgi:hypothetical protein
VVVSQHVVEGNNVGRARDLLVVTNQAGVAKGQSGHGETCWVCAFKLTTIKVVATSTQKR